MWRVDDGIRNATKANRTSTLVAARHEVVFVVGVELVGRGEVPVASAVRMRSLASRHVVVCGYHLGNAVDRAVEAGWHAIVSTCPPEFGSAIIVVNPAALLPSVGIVIGATSQDHRTRVIILELGRVPAP